MMREWPECSAGLQTGCRAGVRARIGSGSITKSHRLGTGVGWHDPQFQEGRTGRIKV